MNSYYGTYISVAPAKKKRNKVLSKKNSGKIPRAHKYESADFTCVILKPLDALRAGTTQTSYVLGYDTTFRLISA